MKMLKRWISVCLVILLLAGVAFDHSSLIGSTVEAADVTETGEMEDAAAAEATALTTEPAADTPSVLSETGTETPAAETPAEQPAAEAPAEQPAAPVESTPESVPAADTSSSESAAAGQNTADTPAATPAPEVKKQEAMELKQEVKDAEGNVICEVTANIEEDTFIANTSEVTMKVSQIDEALEKEIKNLAEETLTEDKELGSYFLYKIEFQVNGTTTEPGKEVKITFEPKDYKIDDVKKANVFYYNEANSPAGNKEAEIKEIIQKQEKIEALQAAGQSIENIDEDYDLTEITLKEEGNADKIVTEGRRSTVYGCYLEEDKPEEVKDETPAASEEEKKEESELNSLNFENDDVTITVSEVEAGAIPEGAELKVVPILADDEDTEDQYKEVEEQIQKKAEEDEKDIKGFLAYDITFVDADGNEVEPNSEVKVTMEYKEPALPAWKTTMETQDTEVSVLHLEEDKDGNVKEVVDMNEAGQVDVVETDDSQQVQKIEMRTESFSAYTIYWYSFRRDIQVHYVDTEGNSLDSLAAGGWTTMNNNSTLVLKDSDCKADIEGYSYLKATVADIDDFASAPSEQEIFRLRISSGDIQYSTSESGNNNWKTLYRHYYTVYMVYEKDSSSGGESGATGDLAHRKYVTDNGDGTYGLTLNVTGAMGTETNPAKVDVVLLVDVSTSMSYDYSSERNSPTRIEKTKEAVKELTDALAEKSETVDSKWKVVTFGSTGSIRTENWVSATQAYNSVNSIFIRDGVGTNYEDGFAKVASAMSGARSDAEKIVIFLTDGEPTLYGSDGSGPGNCTTQDIINGAAAKAATISCNQFYAVGIGLGSVDIYEQDWWGDYEEVGSTTGTAILTTIKDSVTSATKKEVYNTADQGTDLTDIFADIAGDITTYTATDVTIVDTLTDEVDAVGTTPTVMVTTKDGTDVTNTEVEAGNITASYDPETKQLKLDFDENYELKPDYTYSVTMQIKPNETAKTKYVDNNYTYPDIGEADTGDTSAGKKGFYSNVKGTAKVTWTTNGEDKEGLYNRPVVQLPKEDTPTPPPTTEKELSREKYVKDNKDGSYDLTLNVSGQVGSLSQKAKVDIVFVLDLSGSMANGTRLQNAKDSVNTLTSTLKNNETVDSRWKLVTFSSSVREDDSLYNEWVTADTINNKVNSFTDSGWWGSTGDCTGGTNYEAALTKAGEALNADGRQDAEKIVIFLTDGQPTFYGESTTGGGDHTTQADYDGAINGAKKITCDRFYAIGMDLPDDVGGGYSNGLDMTGLELLENVADSVNTSFRYVKNVEDIDNLASVFSDIAGSITSFLCSDVTITDTLSQWAEAADDNAKLEIKVVKKVNGNETVVGTSSNGTVTMGATLTLPATETNQAATLSASYNKDTKQLVLDFPTTYQLESNYTYYVTIKIAPTAEAYQHYETNKTYPHEGDETTDAPDNIPATSSMMPGFYSNESATVTYTYNGQVEKKEYLKPVIQVKESSEEDNPYIEIEKVFEGIEDPEEELTDFRIEVYSDPSCELVYLIDTLCLDDQDVTQEGNKYVWTLDNLEAGTYYLKEEGQTVEMTVGGDQVQKYTVTTTVNRNSVTEWPVTVETQAPTYSVVGDIVRKTSCNNKDFDFLSNYNFIAASLKTDRQYFIWTPTKLSAGERDAIKQFVSVQEGNWSQIVDLTADVYFYSGLDNLEDGITVNGGTVKVSEADGQGKRTLTFASGSSQWAQVLYGQYEKTDAVDAEISIVNSYEENGIAVDIEKCGTDYDVKLDGAKFELYRQKTDQDWEKVDEYDITDAVELSRVTPGIYKLVETQSPRGYSLLGEEIYFQIASQQVTLLDKTTMVPISNNSSEMYRAVSENGQWKIQVKNNCIYELPESGSTGIYWYLFGGVLLMMAASLMVYKNKRREVLER